MAVKEEKTRQKMDRQNTRNPDDELVQNAKQSIKEGHDLQSHGRQEMAICVS
jgi:hypothetical protein